TLREIVAGEEAEGLAQLRACIRLVSRPQIGGAEQIAQVFAPRLLVDGPLQRRNVGRGPSQLRLGHVRIRREGIKTSRPTQVVASVEHGAGVVGSVDEPSREPRWRETGQGESQDRYTRRNRGPSTEQPPARSRCADPRKHEGRQPNL